MRFLGDSDIGSLVQQSISQCKTPYCWVQRDGKVLYSNLAFQQRFMMPGNEDDIYLYSLLMTVEEDDWYDRWDLLYNAGHYEVQAMVM